MKILIIKTSALGDILHCLPILPYLKAKFPSVQVDWVVEKAGASLVSAHPDVRSTIVIDSKRWRKSLLSKSTLSEIGATRRLLKEELYDVVIDLQGNCKSALLMAMTRAKLKAGFGWKSAPEWPNCLFSNQKFNPPKGKNIREDYLSLVQNIFQDNTKASAGPILLNLSSAEKVQLGAILKTLSGQVTLVAAGSNWPNKQLSPETLVSFLKKVEGTILFAYGNEAEKMAASKMAGQCPFAELLPPLSLPLLQHVMKRCNRVIAMDSLPLHLAALAAIPTFSFFGPSSAKKYAPIGPQHQHFQGACPYGLSFEKRCPRLRTCPTGACLKGASVSETIEKLI